MGHDQIGTDSGGGQTPLRLGEGLILRTLISSLMFVR